MSCLSLYRFSLLSFSRKSPPSLLISLNLSLYWPLFYLLSSSSALILFFHLLFINSFRHLDISFITMPYTSRSSSTVPWHHRCQEPPNGKTFVSHQVGLLLMQQNKLVTPQHFKMIFSNVLEISEEFLQQNLLNFTSVEEFISLYPFPIFWSSKMFFSICSSIFETYFF